MVILFQQKILIPWLIFHLCDLAQRDPSEIYVGWGVPVKGRMLADVVVPLHERRDSAAALGDALVSADVDVLLLEGPPEPLDEYVVVGAAAAVHAQAGRAAFPVEDAGELSRRVLAALVRVEDLEPYLSIASRTASSQKFAESVVERRLERMRRLYRSMTAVR